MKIRLLIILLVTSLFTSCAVLTQSQVKMVEGLAISADTLTKSPAMIFQGMSEVRIGRGLLYASSLSSPAAHFKEISGIAESTVKREASVKKALTYITVLNSYTRSLRSIANKSRWSTIGTELRGIGNKTDSVLIAINDNEWMEEDIPVGFAKLSGQYSALLTETYMKNRQTKAIRSYVTESDSLVRACTDTLIAVFKSKEMDDLIAHEHSSLASDYKVCLEAYALRGIPYEMEIDRQYISLYEKMDAVSRIRSSCISALRAFANAHHKLSLNLQNRSRESRKEQIQEIAESITTLNSYSLQLSQLIEKVK